LAKSSLIDVNEWIINMSFVDLRGLNLSQTLHMDSTSLQGAYLQGANISEAELDDVNFSGVNLQGANLSATKLFRAILKDANPAGADLTRANQLEVTGITV
jgi:uncharacterized protein YjbI with pentapeptide repeats